MVLPVHHGLGGNPSVSPFRRLLPGNKTDRVLLGFDLPMPSLPAAGAEKGQDQHQYHQPLHCPSSFWMGSRTVKQVPFPSRRWAVTSPPWRRAVSRTIERPNPVPPAARERALSTR